MTKDDLMTTVGTNVKAYRLLRNMTQEQLAELVGVSTSFCANIERGKKGLSIFVLRDFADALGVTANDLLYASNTGQRVDNITVLLQNKSDSFLSLVEQMLNLTEVYLQKQQRITDT